MGVRQFGVRGRDLRDGGRREPASMGGYLGGGAGYHRPGAQRADRAANRAHQRRRYGGTRSSFQPARQRARHAGTGARGPECARRGYAAGQRSRAAVRRQAHRDDSQGRKRVERSGEDEREGAAGIGGEPLCAGRYAIPSGHDAQCSDRHQLHHRRRRRHRGRAFSARRSKRQPFLPYRCRSVLPQNIRS